MVVEGVGYIDEGDNCWMKPYLQSKFFNKIKSFLNQITWDFKETILQDLDTFYDQ